MNGPMAEAPDTEDVTPADVPVARPRRTWPWWQKTLVIAGCVLVAFTGAGIGLVVWANERYDDRV